MKDIFDYLKELATTTQGDIHEHWHVLFRYAAYCDHITEFGYRGGISTMCMLAARPKKLITYDICPNCQSVFEWQQLLLDKTRTDFQFKLADVLTADIEPTELLLIDTYHEGSHLTQELILHADKVSKCIILHDTDSYARVGEAGGQGLMTALEQFVDNNSHWRIKEHYKNCNGLTIVERR